jgi:ABC-type amino acid transport system permease subunit
MSTVTYFLWGRLLEGGPAMGLAVNLLLSAIALLGGGLIGLPLGIFRATARPSLLAPVSLVLTVIRGTPLLLLVLWTFLLVQVVAAASLAPVWIGCGWRVVSSKGRSRKNRPTTSTSSPRSTGLFTIP